MEILRTSGLYFVNIRWPMAFTTEATCLELSKSLRPMTGARSTERCAGVSTSSKWLRNSTKSTCEAFSALKTRRRAGFSSCSAGFRHALPVPSGSNKSKTRSAKSWDLSPYDL